MTKILEIYEKYKIMPALQQHQLRVAAVAQQICASLSADKIDQKNIVTACLLHDMGNIIKFDLSKFPEFLEPEGVSYWQKVKDDYIQKYKTTDEHPATLEIAREIGASDRVVELVSVVGFTQGSDNAASDDYGRKICAYADMRVGPHGILSMEDRLIDGAFRYTNQKFKPGERNDPFAIALRQIEDQIFSISTIKPSDITEESSQSIIEQLKEYEI